MLARADFGIGALKPVEPDHGERLILVIGGHHDRGSGAFAGQLHDIALRHAERLHRTSWKARDAAPAFFLARRRNLQADGVFARGFAIGHDLRSLPYGTRPVRRAPRVAA